MKRSFIIVCLLLFIAMNIFCVDPIDIVRKLDNNEIYSSIKYSGEMIITISGKKYEKTFISYAKGNKNSFMEFTNPDDEGTKYMKKDGNMFVYSEDLEEVMPITGHMLRESMMGSDLSYEDAVENDTLESQYNVKIVAEIKFDDDTNFKGRDVWVLELTAKKKAVSYAKQKIWVDKETFAGIKVEQYALSGTKLKEWLILDAKWIGDRYFTTEVQVRDLLRKDSKTIFKLIEIELDVDIPDRMFSLRNLEQ